MVFLKTKNIRPKRLFIIMTTLFAINAGLIAFCANQITTITQTDSSIVKDDSVVANDANQIEENSQVESLIQQDDRPIITTYVVKSGDTLSTIASKFSISTNTVLWANDLTKKSVIKEGQKLTILPVSGVIYTVAKGNTLGGIALKFDADIDEIIAFNDLEDNKVIKVGMKLIIPNAELPLEKTVVTPKKIASTTKKESDTNTKEIAVVHSSEPETTQVTEEYFINPFPGSVLTQGIHGYNGVDLGGPVGTSVYAAAKGTVIVAKPSGYNGGYGKYIVIEHDNGTQTLYGHLSSVLVKVGDNVNQKQKIALSGNTGKSTGPHLHFEVRGGTNPLGVFKKLTRF